MKNYIKLLLLFTPITLIGCNNDSVTIASLPVFAHGEIYNFTSEANEVALSISEQSSAKWANTITTDMFTVPTKMKGKQIVKAERISDTIVNISFAYNADADIDTNETLEMSIDPKAFKGATVKSAYTEINYYRSGLYGSGRSLGTNYFGCTGTMYGIKSNQEYEQEVSAGEIKISDCKSSGFKTTDDSKVYIEACADGTFTYEIYGFEPAETSTTEFYVTIDNKSKLFTTVFENIEGVDLKLTFVKHGDTFRAKDFLGSQYFVKHVE